MKTSVTWLFALFALCFATSCGTTQKISAWYKYRRDFHVPKTAVAHAQSQTWGNATAGNAESANSASQNEESQALTFAHGEDEASVSRKSAASASVAPFSHNRLGKRLAKRIERVEEQFFQSRKSTAGALDYVNPVVERKTPGMAIAGFVCSLVGLFILGFILGILGIIFSVIALNKYGKEPGRYKGKGLAIAGLIIGIVALVGAVLLLAAMN